MFLHPLLKIIAKLLSQIPETSLTAGVTISETIIGILGSIVGKHSDDVESASTIVVGINFAYCNLKFNQGQHTR